MRDVKVIEELCRPTQRTARTGHPRLLWTFIWITHDLGVILSDERSEESMDPYSCQQSYCAPAALAFSCRHPNPWAIPTHA